jgi:hypothetical protein
MKAVWVGAVAVLAASAALALGQQARGTSWISAGTAAVLPAQAEFPTPTGRVGLLLSGGPVDMKGHPFFTPLGKNGRACVTCHQPAYGMSFSAEAAA